MPTLNASEQNPAFSPRPLLVLRHFCRIAHCLPVVALAAAWGGPYASPAAAETFYVSPHGRNSSAGTSIHHPWRTVARVNAARLRPGDTVRFQGGRTFSDSTLKPPASGSKRRTITFSSYGRGQATIAHSGIAVWFSGRNRLVFDNLALTTNNTSGAVLSGSPSKGSDYITIRRSTIWNTAGVGINSPTHADSHWLIRRNRIFHIGDSGLILSSSDDVISGNTISDTGWNRSIPWDKHGIYLKGSRAVISENTITGFQANGVSLRFDDALVKRNVISNGPFAIAYFDFSKHHGTSYVVGNRTYNVHIGFYFGPDPDWNDGSNPVENFIISGNVFKITGGVGADLIGGRYSRLTFVKNVLDGYDRAALRAVSPSGGAYIEHHNHFIGPSLFDWNGGEISYAQYRSSSGQGARDRFSGRGD